MVYFILLALILGLAYPLLIKNKTKTNTILYLVITFGAMFFLASVRHGIGYDYYNYIAIFEQYRGLSWQQALFEMSFEPGFAVLSKAMTMFITSPTVMYTVYSLIILLPIAYVLYRDSVNIWLSTWFYVTMTFLFNNMNFIRQSLACSVAALGYKYFRERKPIPFFIIALFAASFHKTALILIPIYFITQIPLTKITGAIYAAIVLITFITSHEIIDFVTDYIFKSYKGSRYVMQILGPSFLVIPFTLLIAGACLYPAWKKRSSAAGPMLNLLIISATIWLFGSLRHMIVERLCMYGYFYSTLLIPEALQSILVGEEDKAELARLSKQIETSKNSPKSVIAARDVLIEKKQDGRVYYYSAIGLLLFVTFIYIYYGIFVGGFHGVTTYHTVIPFLEKLLNPPLVKEHIYNTISPFLNNLLIR